MGSVIPMCPPNITTDEDRLELPFCAECGEPITTAERSVPTDGRDPNAGLVHLSCYAHRRLCPVVAE